MHKSLTNQTLLESLTNEAIIMLEGLQDRENDNNKAFLQS